MRPIYVRRQDRENEARFIEQLRQRLHREAPSSKWDFRHEGDMSAWDGVVLRDGTPFALVEVKSRNGEPYEEWHISQSKIDKITSEAKQRNVKFFLIFAWSGVAYVGDVLKFPPLQTHISGRTDRNDPADLEKMYLIPAKFFQKI